MTSQYLNIWYTQKAIFAGSLLQGKLDNFYEKNLLDLIALVFLIFLIIFDQKTRILSFTRSLITLIKNGFNMMCFLPKKRLIIERQHGLIYISIEKTFDLSLRNNHMVWFVLSFSDIANSFDGNAEGFNPFKIILIKRQYS